MLLTTDKAEWKITCYYFFIHKTSESAGFEMTKKLNSLSLYSLKTKFL